MNNGAGSNSAGGQVKSLVLRVLRNREALTVAAFSGLTILGGLVGNRVLTEVASPRALGDFYLYMTFVLWATVPSQAAAVYMFRHWPIALERGRISSFGRAVLVSMLAQAGLAALVLVLMHVFFADLSRWSVVFWLWIACVGFSVGQSFEPAQNSARRRVAAGVLNFIGVPFRSFALVLGVWLLGAQTGSELLVVAGGHYVVYALACLVAFAFLARATAGVPTEEADELSISSFLAHWTPYLAGTITIQGCISAERWGLARLVDSGTTALFVLATGLAVAISAAATGFINNYFFPVIFRAAVEPRPIHSAKRHIARFLVLTAAALTLTAGSIAVLAPWITVVLFGKGFRDVAGILPWAMVGAGVSVLGEGFAIFSYTARETLVTNVARIVSQLSYIAILINYRPASEPALAFSRVYAARGVLYALLMLGIAVWLVRRERARAPLVETTAAPRAV